MSFFFSFYSSSRSGLFGIRADRRGENMSLALVCVPVCRLLFNVSSSLKHKDSFGKSENLSKIFFAEILVFYHDYEGKSSSSNGLL